MEYKLLCFLILSLYYLNKQYISATELSLNLEENPIKSYNDVIKLMRDSVRSNVVYDGMPTMKPPSKPVTYILLKLLATRGEVDVSLTVAISKENLYTVGYADQSLGKAFFFDDHDGIDASIFPGAVVKEILPFEGGYDELQGKAGLRRENMKMTLVDFKNFMLPVHGATAAGHPNFHQTQAKFLLYVTQAFSEAARFQYVQKKFNGRSKEGPPDYTVPSLENNWGPISSAVKNAVKRILPSPIILANKDGSRLEIKTVDKIKTYMGILLYVA